MAKTMTSQKSLSQVLGAHIHALQFDDLPPATVEKAKDCFIDYFASAFSGLGHPLSDTYIGLAHRLGGAGPCPILGRGQGSNPAYAAFANAAIGHISETDDGHRASIMHIGTVVIPVIVALAEQLGANGKQCIEACVVGYDAAIGVGEALGPEHYHTWHTTATAGCFGAAAAAAKLMGLGPEHCAHTLGHAGTLTSGLWQFLEDGRVEAKALHPGNSALNSVTAAYLASENIPGADRIFEGERGLFKAMSASPDLDALLKGIARPPHTPATSFRIDEANFKAYPTCGQTHSMIDAARTIMASHSIRAHDVTRIEARVYQKTLDIADIKDPKSVEQAKFSLSFCLAMLIVRGKLTFTNMTDEALHDPEIRTLMGRIEVVHAPDMEKLFPACRPCVVTVECGEEVYSAENHYRRGDPETPMSRQDMKDKFAELAGSHVAASEQKALLRWIEDLDQASDIYDFRRFARQ
jgi:2-methylcitrate dehydratase PrpD